MWGGPSAGFGPAAELSLGACDVKSRQSALAGGRAEASPYSRTGAKIVTVVPDSGLP
jgi:hypothetical protein